MSLAGMDFQCLPLDNLLDAIIAQPQQEEYLSEADHVVDRLLLNATYIIRRGEPLDIIILQ